MNRRVVLSLLLSVCALCSVVGQTKPVADSDDVVRITTNLVQIDAVVTKDGKPVTNLTAEDFEIYQDGRPQQITSFAFISNLAARERPSTPEKDAPVMPGGVPTGPVKPDAPHRTIAIVVDDLGLSMESMTQVRRQLRKFVNEQLQPDDLVAIVRTGGEIGALQQFTNDRRLLTRAVEQLRWNVCSRVGVSVFPRYGQALTGFDWENCDPYDDGTKRSLNLILDALARLPGRKSMILMSDDMPIEKQEEGQLNPESAAMVGPTIPIGARSRNRGDALRAIAEKAIRSSVVIYSVDTQGLQVTGLTAADNVNGMPNIGPPKRTPLDDPRTSNALLRSRWLLLQQRREGGEMIAKQTGGFQIHNSNGFELDRILEDQSGYYLIGYRPADETFNRQFHHIKAKVKRPGMSLRTRFGFWGVSEEDVKRAVHTTSDDTNLALMSPFAKQDLELELNSFFANGNAEGSIVRSFIYLNAANLAFTPVNDRHETSLELDGVIFGDNGAVVERVKHGATLSLRENEYQAAVHDGLRLRFDMPAKVPGSYQVRIAVRDATSAKIGSAGQFVAVPDLKTKRLAVSGIVLRNGGNASTPMTVMATPPGRRFRANSDLNFAFLIYNAPFAPATQSPNLMMETRLFSEGRSVGPTAQTAIDVRNQPDRARLFVNGAVRLTSDLEPGKYYLQVAITDKTAKEKQPPVIQWVDFEIVK